MERAYKLLPWVAAAAIAGCRTSSGLSSDPQLLRMPYESRATGGSRDVFVYLPRDYGVEDDRRWPVLLFLHGNGERGDAKEELDYLLKNGPLYEAWIQKRDLPFVIVAPQLPMYGRDETADYLRDRTRAEIPVRLDRGVPERPDRFATPQPMVGALEEVDLPYPPYGPPMGWPELEQDVIDILESVLAEYRTDRERQYVTGVSYGGFGTWYLASRHPERFAAMVPVVGFGHPELMGPIARAGIPVWCIAGGRDTAVEARYFYVGMNRLESLGHPDLRFTIEADMGHDVWTRVYEGEDVYAWMLRYRRDDTPGASSRPATPR